ncbi:beta-hexosaminidase 2 [Planoprotostelium fungivorum]|uniref:Beta-hexosaminidase n=1 Tax=Planoprotostelium fungivorum TaxID=1890364 RepID=A0A2P6NXH5_9EUKA|nr:beta-hexosaminidase 2 [Planoprotostelium fungivorum]
MMLRSIIVFTFFFLTYAHINVWPLPVSFTQGGNTIGIDAQIEILEADDSTFDNATLLGRVVHRYQHILRHTLWTPEYRNEDKSQPNGNIIKKIYLIVDRPQESLDAKTNESYVMDVPSDLEVIRIQTPTTFGAMRALETLRQMVELQEDGSRVIRFAPLHIEDAPAFSHRGLMLDTSRNYFPVKDILRTLDGMSMNKLNVFHWHIVDSQSFPLRSNAVPELADKGAYRKKGKLLVYNEDDVRTIVQYGIEDDGSRVIRFAPLHIEDAPAFSHRGLMLDTSRNYFPVKDILRTLDGMSMNKLNVFHWHIVDSQSFPLRSNAVPELADKGAYRKKGKLLVYNEDDVRTIVQHGIERGVRVIPELDMPGHTRSWAWSHPEISVCIDSDWTKNAAEPPAGQLDPINPATYQLLDRLLSDIAPWFADTYWHAVLREGEGGDEVKFTCWNESSSIRDWMQQHNTQDMNQLVQLFAAKLYTMIDNQGKVPILWEEMVLDFGVKAPSESVVQVWRGVPAVSKVTSMGYKTVVSSNDYWYLDCGRGGFVDGGNSWCDPYKSWQTVYQFDIVAGLSEEQSSLIMGGEVCLWAEQVDPINLDRILWPRSAAAAEVLWSGKDKKGQQRDAKEAMPRFWDMRERLVEAGVAAEPLQPLYCAFNNCWS